jgi:sec-independent protein translocase protein TatA
MELGMPELLIILVIVILIFGPGRLVKLGGELGKGIKEFRHGISHEQKPQETTDGESMVDKTNHL